MPTHTPVTVETCFDSPAFCAWWDAADAYINNDSYIYSCMGCPDDGWALDCLVDCYNRGMEPGPAVEETVDGYDPTP